jgi:hypothetical protein
MTKKTSRGGVPEEEKRDRREKEARGSPSMSESSGEACRPMNLHRQILSSSTRFERRNEKEMGEVSLGYL